MSGAQSLLGDLLPPPPRGKVTTAPLTPELMEGMRRLREQINRGDIPPAVALCKSQIFLHERNLLKLYRLFNGILCQSAVDDVVSWKMHLDAVYLEESVKILREPGRDGLEAT